MKKIAVVFFGIALLYEIYRVSVLLNGTLVFNLFSSFILVSGIAFLSFVNRVVSGVLTVIVTLTFFITSLNPILEIYNSKPVIQPLLDKSHLVEKSYRAKTKEELACDRLLDKNEWKYNKCLAQYNREVQLVDKYNSKLPLEIAKIDKQNEIINESNRVLLENHVPDVRNMVVEMSKAILFSILAPMIIFFTTPFMVKKPVLEKPNEVVIPIGHKLVQTKIYPTDEIIIAEYKAGMTQDALIKKYGNKRKVMKALERVKKTIVQTEPIPDIERDLSRPNDEKIIVLRKRA